MRGNRYSVPDECAGRVVAIRITLDDVLTVHDGERIVAEHRLRPQAAGWSTIPEHHAALWEKTGVPAALLPAGEPDRAAMARSPCQRDAQPSPPHDARTHGRRAPLPVVPVRPRPGAGACSLIFPLPSQAKLSRTPRAGSPRPGAANRACAPTASCGAPQAAGTCGRGSTGPLSSSSSRVRAGRLRPGSRAGTRAGS